MDDEAAQVLYDFANHAAPTRVWREEQKPVGKGVEEVGDMPHNWASAEFIRLATHLLELDRGDELHLLEGMPAQWLKAGMVTRLNGVLTPFGPLHADGPRGPAGQDRRVGNEAAGGELQERRRPSAGRDAAPFAADRGRDTHLPYSPYAWELNTSLRQHHERRHAIRSIECFATRAGSRAGVNRTWPAWACFAMVIIPCTLAWDNHALAASVDQYNVVIQAPSKDFHGAMPLGNGDIGVSAWVERGGDLLFYISKTDAYDENHRLLKLGRVRIKLSPNPFRAGRPFRQELKLADGEFVVQANEGNAAVALQLWVDANQPLVHVEVHGKRPMEVRVSLESWRTTQQTVKEKGSTAILRKR